MEKSRIRTEAAFYLDPDPIDPVGRLIDAWCDCGRHGQLSRVDHLTASGHPNRCPDYVCTLCGLYEDWGPRCYRCDGMLESMETNAGHDDLWCPRCRYWLEELEREEAVLS